MLAEGAAVLVLEEWTRAQGRGQQILGEIAASLLAVNEGFIPPTMNLDQPDATCDLDYVPNAARELRVGLFLSNSFGFGGMNGVVAVRSSHGL